VPSQDKQPKRRAKHVEVRQDARDLADKRVAEKKIVDKIVYWIVGILVVLILGGVLIGALYVHTALQPIDRHSTKKVDISVPLGASNEQIGETLVKQKVIKNAKIFTYYVKSHNFSAFQAGFYELKPSMSVKEVANQLSNGGSQISKHRVLVKEGITIDQIGDQIAKKTPYSKKAFLKLMKDQTFAKQLAKKYPDLLASSMAKKNVRYHLEGYLYPATYNYYDGLSLKGLVRQMVAQENTYMKSYYKKIKSEGLTVQQVLTLASLCEREGNNASDRAKIAGVFFNRIAAGMPLQSDISVMYALNTHKTHLYNKDTAVKSPYNLYKNKGYGPGPFNSPSIASVHAVLNPKSRAMGYLYFVADLKTGKVYYSQNFEEHTSTNTGIQTKNNSVN
jgi:UPF0755 protein